MSDSDKMVITVAVLGGTGKEGSGLAIRWSQAGYKIIIGSRDAERGAEKAAELNALIGGEYITGTDNVSAAAQANLAVLTVPYSAHQATLESVREELQGKVLVDVTVPLRPPKVREVYIPDGLSASLEAQDLLGDGVKVGTAFQHVSAAHLKDADYILDCDVLICGDDDDAKASAMQLVEAAGMRAIEAGPLANSIAVEAITPVLLYINKRYQVVSSGIRITGLA